MRIVFMGTPEFAVPVLDALHHDPDHDILAVVTVPDHMGGRDRNRRLESAVKRYAVKKELPVLQPKKLNHSGFLNELREMKPDCIVVVAFKKLPKLVWSIPKYGTINLHASLLPAYRGAAPINHAIIRGETETGMTTFFIDEKIDTGEILLQSKMAIERDDTAGSLYQRMMKSGGDLVLKTLEGIKNDQIQPTPQDDKNSSDAPKVFFDKNEIDFNQSTEDVYNFIRGMSPYPATWIRFQEKILKIYFAEPVFEAHHKNPGEIDTDYRSYFRIYAKDGYLELTDVQMEGKRRMNIRDFLNGLRPEDGKQY